MDKSQLLLFFSDSIPDKWNLSDCFPDADQFGQQVFQQVEFQHVGAVTLGYGGIFVGFDEQSVYTYGNTGLATVSISCGIPPVTPLVWLGCCREWVTSRMTGKPKVCISGMPR